MRRAAPALLVLACFALLLAAPAASAAPPQVEGPPPQAELGDLEDEVMCPICGTLLELAQSPQAMRQRVLVRGLIAEGKSKDEIKDELVAQYGRGVLALPEDSGFSLSAYVVPVVGFALAVIALAIGVARWRRAGRRPPDGPKPASGPSGDDAERLDADLRRYDL